MAEYLIQDTTLTGLADKIRTKTGATGTMTASEMESKVDSILTPTDGSIATKTASDLSASGATVTVPAGYYASQVTKSVTTATQATPDITVSSSGLITASTTQSAGYVSAGTKSGTKQLTTQAAKTITPSTSSQTAVASGVYTTGAITVAGDADLVADNIRAGKEIFGVTGSSWVGNLTFSGTYATSTYYTAAGSFLTVDKDTGRAFVTVQGGTSTTYENIYFTATSLPSGVTLLTPPGGTNGAGFGTAGTAQRYFTAVLTGVTGKINVAVTMNTRANTNYDAVNCALTVTYA